MIYYLNYQYYKKEDVKSHLRRRMDTKQNPAIRKLLMQDQTSLDQMQAQMATAREFLIIIRLRKEKESEVQSYLSRIEKSLKDQGSTTKKAGQSDIKRLLGVYYKQNVTTEKYEDYDENMIAPASLSLIRIILSAATPIVVCGYFVSIPQPPMSRLSCGILAKKMAYPAMPTSYLKDRTGANSDC